MSAAFGLDIPGRIFAEIRPKFTAEAFSDCSPLEARTNTIAIHALWSQRKQPALRINGTDLQPLGG
jgi:hypothetical protein